MADVTVLGVNGSTVSVSFSSAQNAAVAQSLLANISNQVQSGTITPFTYDGAGPLEPPSGNNFLIVTDMAAASLPSSTSAVVDVAGKPVLLFGGTAASQVVVSESGLTYFANTGVGTVVAGGGNNVITELTGGDHLFLTDGGGNVITALAGNDTIEAGAGGNSIVLGTGNDMVQVTGSDSITAGSGNDTVEVLAGNAVVHGGSGTLFFVNAAGSSTVFGGEGSSTISGGMGGGLYAGGSNGNNLLISGAEASTLFGGGNGDTLYAVGSGNDLLAAGSGSETLVGANGGNDTFKGGFGSDQMQGGFGHNTFMAGQGDETLMGGSAGNTYVFSALQSSGHITVTDFMPSSDTIQLQGFSGNELANVLKTQTHAGGGTTITLNDTTTVTFQNLTNLDKSSFS
jgi:Ca2+-binding RTX toxin-like protein